MDAKTARTHNIRSLVEAAGGPTRFAERYGDAGKDRPVWSQAQVSQWISVDRPKGIGHALAREIERRMNLPHGRLDQVLGEDDQAAVSPPETDPGYVRVEQIGEAGMGDARINDDYPDVIRSVDFTEPYIRSLVGFMPAPGRLKLVTGHGDSMVPTIMPGDVVLVDTGCNCFDGDGLYLVNSGNGQQIKMLQDRGSALFVVSANRDYPEFEASPDMIIGGKVYLRNRLDRMA